MKRFGYILLAGFILGCGDNSTGPEPDPEPKPLPEPKTEPVPNHDAGDLVIELPGGVKMAFIWIEPGTELSFIYSITITKGFYLGKYELTQQQWQQVMLTAPWSGRADVDSIGPNFPAIHISGHDAQAYVEKLTTLQNNGIYRLATRREWMYACQAGTSTLWSFETGSLNDYAWWSGNSEGGLHTVGTKLPNPWGLYDMYGNVQEWGQDTGKPDNRTLYGGDYLSTMEYIPCFRFIHASQIHGHPTLGLRVLREGPKIAQP